MSVPSVRLLVVGVAMVGLVLVACGNVGGSDVEACKGEGQLLDKCKRYVMKGNPQEAPSNACCQAIRGADMPCVCKGLTAGVAGLVDIKKVCFVANKCGMSMPPAGTKCGSLVIPSGC
uniref:Putative lipid-transfer protein DIR1 n=1 Tax=Anthurium amnicola TaxID=1678845 RepID=A0A1D1YNG7_9ARAE